MFLQRAQFTFMPLAVCSLERHIQELVNVLHESNNRMDFVHEDGEIWYVPSPSEWSSKLGLENLRLFFLIMQKF